MADEANLAGTGLSEDVQSLIVDQLYSGTTDLQLLVKKFGGDGASIAIRQEDFPVLREVAGSVANIVAGSVFHVWAPAALANLIVLLFTFRKNGIDIEPLQGAVLRELKRRGGRGLSIEEISLLLDLPADNVSAIVSGLQAIPRHDGVVVSLVTKGGDNHWLATGF